MSDTRYRRGPGYAADMAVYARTISADNHAEHQRLEHNLVHALREDVTPRQREYLLLYYGEGLNMREIGERYGVNRSTVSRTIQRGRAAAPALPALPGPPPCWNGPGDCVCPAPMI